MTFHATIVYADLTSGKLRHRRIDYQPSNLLLHPAKEGAILSVISPDSESISDQYIAKIGPEADFELSPDPIPWPLALVSDLAVSIRSNGCFLSADEDGFVRNNRDWCREWEHFRVIDLVGFSSISSLRKCRWLKDDSGTLAPPAAEEDEFEHGLPAIASPSSLRNEPSVDGLYRHSGAFGRTNIGNIEKESALLFEIPTDGTSYVPRRLHTISPAGLVQRFSRWNPLIYFCVYGHDSYYECLRLALESLQRHGGFAGRVAVACDRTRDELLQYVPDNYKESVLVSRTSKADGWFSRYNVEHGLYDNFQPILYFDVDVVFDKDINEFLARVLVQEQICCGTEAGTLPDLADKPPDQWPEYTGNYFGRWLYVDEGSSRKPAALVNSGEIGFCNVSAVKVVNSLVRASAQRQSTEHLRIYGDQPILGYVLNKIGSGNFELINEYRRLARAISDVPVAGRRGWVHFHLSSGAPDVSEKLRAMAEYFGQIESMAAE